MLRHFECDSGRGRGRGRDRGRRQLSKRHAFKIRRHLSASPSPWHFLYFPRFSIIYIWKKERETVLTDSRRRASASISASCFVFRLYIKSILGSNYSVPTFVWRVSVCLAVFLFFLLLHSCKVNIAIEMWTGTRTGLAGCGSMLNIESLTHLVGNSVRCRLLGRFRNNYLRSHRGADLLRCMICSYINCRIDYYRLIVYAHA